MSDERYGKLFYRMWTDPKFRAYTSAERFSLCYVYAGPDTRTEGLFKLNVREGARSVGIGAGEFERHVERFASEGRIGWDPAFDLVLLPKSYGYQPAKNSNDAKGIVNRIAAFGSHWMVGELLAIAEEAEASADEDRRFLTVQLRHHFNEIGGCDPRPDLVPIHGSDPGAVVDGNPHTQAHTHSQARGVDPFVEKTRFVGGACFVDEGDDQHNDEVAS